jgi:hypothetical protein
MLNMCLTLALFMLSPLKALTFLNRNYHAFQISEAKHVIYKEST